MNQVGVHTGYLVVALPSPYTAVTKTAPFSITVVDPCSVTSLVWVVSPTAIDCTVSQTSKTNGVDPL